MWGTNSTFLLLLSAFPWAFKLVYKAYSVYSSPCRRDWRVALPDWKTHYLRPVSLLCALHLPDNPKMFAVTFLLLLPLTAVIGLPNTPITLTLNDVTRLDTTLGPHFFKLPDNFDLSHPALNLTLRRELLATAPNVSLPELPGNLKVSVLPAGSSPNSPSADTVDTFSTGFKTICDTSSGSPEAQHVQNVGIQLYKLGSTLCKTLFPLLGFDR
jgi:hypothetical protein